MSQQTILVVEDERALADALRYNFERQGYRVVLAREGNEALRLAETESPSCVVLDVMLPGLDGFEVCRRIRNVSSVPILMLTARGEEVDRVMGLEIGADDYVTKPFSLRELMARIRALIRRSGQPTEASKQVDVTSGDLRVSPGERRVWLNDAELSLRPQEFQLLAFLMKNRGLALSRRQILDGAWGTDFSGDDRTVDVHVKALREEIEPEPKRPARIVTVRGLGYRFEG